MADPRLVRMLQTLTDEVRANGVSIRALREEVQRQGAINDIALQTHDEDPAAHQDRIATVERKVRRLERKRDDKKRKP